ncbi:VWA domain-containing protein [Streptosporangium sp. NPDC023615]|uniref:VWA domain-containing protein n=1 Tax=Streptosporangium sp. NPDC023615 TaxID=3154794 RepID=UPI0034486264
MVQSERTTEPRPPADGTGSTERAWQLVTAFSNALVQTLLVLLALSVSTASKLVLVGGILALTALTIFPGLLLRNAVWLRRAFPGWTSGLLVSLFRGAQRNVWRLLAAGVLITILVVLAVVPKDEPWRTCQIPDEITLLASDETAPVIRRAAGEFMAGKVDWWGCRQVNITVSGLRAGEARERLRDWTFPVQPASERTARQAPGARPDGWIADFAEEIDYVRRDESPAEGRTFGERTIVATSPLVIAASPALADDLTQGDWRPGGREWASLLRGKSGSRLQVLRTHPRASNVGLMAAAAAPLPDEDLSAKVRLSDDARDMMCRYAGSREASPMLLTEQQLHELNLGLSGAGPAPGGCADPATPGGPPSPVTWRASVPNEPPLTAVYPAGGHAMRYACVSKKWPDLKRPAVIKRTVEEFCDALREILPRYGFRDEGGRLALDRLPKRTSWLRPEAPVADWKPDVLALLHGLRAPLGEHVLVLVDVSGSMARNKVNDGRSRLEAAIQLAQLVVTSRGGDLTTGIETFFPGDGHAADLVPVLDGGKALADELGTVLEDYRAGSRPDPAMRPVLREVLTRMQRTGDPRDRRIVLVLTDGGNPGGLTADDLRGRDGVRLVMLSFDLHGCDTPPLPELRDRELMSCHDVSNDPEQTLDDAFNELRAATG